MAKNYDFEIYAHPSIYTAENSAKERKLRIYFAEPDKGVNEQTGLILLIPGFGGHANSKVYQKMRHQFADKYNLITVQCDYFGWEFMQTPTNACISIENLKYLSPEEISKLYNSQDLSASLTEVLKNYAYPIEISEPLDEDLNNFNDMGIMQALDNISAVIAVMEILKDNNYQIDINKIIIYGHSHGAYLAYLCNALAPHLFSMLIDNSAWTFPLYLKSERKVNLLSNNLEIIVYFNYLAQNTDFDDELLDLNHLYQKFSNHCHIICYHGTEDSLITLAQKQKFSSQIDNLNFFAISQNEVDGEIFQSCEHGLEADYLKLFDLTMANHPQFPTNKKNLIENVCYCTNKHQYFIDYSHGLPILSIN
ncbi:DUF2920 family protein [Clostridiales bacterium COT073_COT-073]|nr:DUF2920 family protein [Clostridiales bacterium COT073_COT-073]